MSRRTLVIYRTYQTSTHRSLGFYAGEEESIISFCHLKFDIQEDDIALERVPVRNVSRSEVICFREVMDQLKDQTERARSAQRRESPEEIKSNLMRMMETVP